MGPNFWEGRRVRNEYFLGSILIWMRRKRSLDEIVFAGSAFGQAVAGDLAFRSWRLRVRRDGAPGGSAERRPSGSAVATLALRSGLRRGDVGVEDADLRERGPILVDECLVLGVDQVLLLGGLVLEDQVEGDVEVADANFPFGDVLGDRPDREVDGPLVLAQVFLAGRDERLGAPSRSGL